MDVSRVTLSVCICTHNPRGDILRSAIRAIADQTVASSEFTVLIVDNASSPRISEDVLIPLKERGIEARLVYEESLGIARARARAIRETKSPWILWVDDDNELAADYLAAGYVFMTANHDVGCFGGRLLLPVYLKPRPWVWPFLPYLAIKDEGEKVLYGNGEHWESCEPPCAGAWVARIIAERYRAACEDGDGRLFRLGRVGSGSLASSEDSLMMRGSFDLKMRIAYVPGLRLWHHLDPRRFRFGYLLRLMYAYGSSHVVLESILQRRPASIPDHYRSISRFSKMLMYIVRTEWTKSAAFTVGLVAYHAGVWREYRASARRRAGEMK